MDVWSKITEALLGYGPVGLTVLISGAIIAYLFVALRGESKARLEDYKAIVPVLDSANKAMVSITNEMASRTTMAAGMGDAIRGLREAQTLTSERLEKIYEIILKSQGVK